MTDLNYAVMPFQVKATQKQTRTMTGLASALALDLGGDLIEPTAYDAWLQDFRGRRLDGPVTLNDSHRYGSIFDVVGKMVHAEAQHDGLDAMFQFIPDDPAADAAWKRADGGYVTGLSIGYLSKSRAPTADERAKGATRVLTEVRISEVSLVQFPMNVRARVHSTQATDDALDMGKLHALQVTTAQLQARVNADRADRVRAFLDKAHASGYGALSAAEQERLLERMRRLQSRMTASRRDLMQRVLARGGFSR